MKNNVNLKYFLKPIGILVSLFTFLILNSQLSTLNSHVHASQQTLRVSPVIINVTLSPGKTHTHEVTVENLSNTPLPLRASLSDFMTDGEEGGYIFEETKANPLLSWIALKETEFILNPKEKKTVHMTINTPKSIPVGGYYGVLFFEPVVQGDQSNATSVNAKVGVLMLANIGVPDPNAKKAEILTFDTDMLHTEGTVPFLVRAKNISLNFLSAKPTLKITPLITVTRQPNEFALEEKIIFPASIRRWSEETTVQNLSPNIYRAEVEISTGNGQVVTAEKYFIVLPVLQTVSIFVIVIIVIFLFIKRKRLGRAIKALIGT